MKSRRKTRGGNPFKSGGLGWLVILILLFFGALYVINHATKPVSNNPKFLQEHHAESVHVGKEEFHDPKSTTIESHDKPHHELPHHLAVHSGNQTAGIELPTRHDLAGVDLHSEKHVQLQHVEQQQETHDSFKVKFHLQLSAAETGSFTLEIYPEWAPLGAKRFRELVESHFYDDVRFFRVIPHFMAQFGLPGDPKHATHWGNIKDEPVKAKNEKGTVSFAKAGPNTRTTQCFINFRDNVSLDDKGFSPFGKVVEGMHTVDSIYQGYGESKPKGHGPEQSKIHSHGNEYLKEEFPKLSYIIKTEIIQ